MIEFTNTFKISDILGIREGDHFSVCIKGRIERFDVLIEDSYINNEGHIVYPTITKGDIVLEGELVCDIVNGKYDIRVNRGEE